MIQDLNQNHCRNLQKISKKKSRIERMKTHDMSSVGGVRNVHYCSCQVQIGHFTYLGRS